ncbi:MAG: hypothetical protein OXI40_09875 [Chloroflexota bacterium]|nr:hypothetical protein [Chloroflexota bacterium]
MQINCPNCNHAIKAEQINIQRMVALCDECSSVFDISTQRSKVKRRKVKRPPHLRILMEDPLHLAFRTNFRLDKSESFQTSAILSGIFSLLTLLMTGLVLEGEVPIFLPFMFMAMAIAAIYSLATNTYNQCHICMEEDAIRVSRAPLPSLTQARQISLDGVESFAVEETSASQREGYDTPRYHVWAKYAGGDRRLVIGDLTDEYASYIASQLNQRLMPEQAASAARLSDSQSDFDELSLEQLQGADARHETLRPKT